MDEQAKNKAGKTLGIGIILLVIGIAIFMWAPSLTENNLAIMQAAKSAQEAADAVSSNNMKEIAAYAVGAACTCAGVVSIISGFMAKRRNK